MSGSFKAFRGNDIFKYVFVNKANTLTLTNTKVGGDLHVTGDQTIDGNLTVSGTTTSVSTDNTVMKDVIVELGTGATGTVEATRDVGFVFERGDAANVFMGWDEGSDKFIFGQTSATGASTGSVTLSATSTILANFETGSGGVTFNNGATMINGDANTLTITEATTAFSGNVNISGDLTVTGTFDSSPTLTTPQINDTTKDHQYTFTVSELTADRNINLPLLTGNDEFTFNAHAQTLTNKTLTAPKFADGGFIADANGNEALSFATTSNAVNFIKITPSATGDAVSISADGTDNNISLNLAAKGAGNVSLNGAAILSANDTAVLQNKTFKPSTKIFNDTNDAAGGILTLSNERGTNNGVADDVAGTILFKTNDAAQNNQDFAKIIASAPAVTSGSESGKLDLQVATTTSGALASVMTITGGAAAASSTTAFTGDVSVGGDLTVSGNDLTFGNGATIVNTDANNLTITEANTVLSGNLKVADGATIGTATTADAITLSSAGKAEFKDDLSLKHDAAVLGFGDGEDVTLTHVHDTGLLINSSRQLQFGDSGTHVSQSSDGILALTADTRVDVAGNLAISGNLTVSGTTTTVNSTVTTVADPIMTIGQNSSDDNKDRGFEFLYNDGTAKRAFMGYDDSASKFTMLTAATNTSEVFSGTTGTLVANLEGTVQTATQNSITTMTGLVSTGALDSGSITSNFGNINNGASTITTTGLITGGNLKVADAGTISTATTADAITLAANGGATFANSITSTGAVLPSASDGAALGSATLEWSDLFLADGAVINLGADQDVTLTHVADTGLLLNAGMQLQFRDSAIHISSDADGFMNVQADTGVNINVNGTDELAITGSTATFGTNLVVPDGATIGSASDTDAISISAGGVVNVSATTASTSASSGALTVAGGAGVAADLFVGDDLSLISDAAVLNFGADSDVNLTHVADTGLLLNSNMQLQFRDSAIHISSDADGYMNVQADTGVNININGTDELAITGSTATFGTNVVVPDAATIGTATTAAAITLAANGTATFSAGIDVTAAAGITLENDETITNTTNGTVLINGGILATGAGNADATIASNGDHNLILQTGNSTTGSITITDGANGDITLAPNGSGNVAVSSDLNLSGNFRPTMTEEDIDAQNGTLSAAAVNKGLIIHTSTTGGGTLTFDSAANYVSNSGLSANNMCIEFFVMNDGDQNVNFAADGGSTVTIKNGATTSVAANKGVKVILRRTGATAVSAYIFGQ